VKRIPPSQQIRQEISSLLSEGIKREEKHFDITGEQRGQHLLQEALEQEVTDHLGRGYYERLREEELHRGYRSGYEPRAVKTSEGRVELKIPQVRETLEPYRSKVVPLIGRKSSLLEYLVQEMYARGLWTRDIEDLFQDAQGQRFLSRSAVSEMTEALWKEYKLFVRGI
jgi:putative transposase